MVDTDSPNYGEGLARGYYLRDVLNATGKVEWWHGTGSFLDYSSPAAAAWWYAPMDAVLALGVDGWKVDGTDPYVVELLEPVGAGGPLTLQAYQDLY